MPSISLCARLKATAFDLTCANATAYVLGGPVSLREDLNILSEITSKS